MSLSWTTIQLVWLLEQTSSTGTGRTAARAPKIEWDPSLLLNSLYLVAILLAGALLIALVNSWRRKGERRLGASDQLAQYRTLYEEGEISQEEFDRLRSLLGGQIRRQVKESAPSSKNTGSSGPPETTAPQPPPRAAEPPETGKSPT